MDSINLLSFLCTVLAVNYLGNIKKREKNSEIILLMLRFEPRSVGWEARMLPLRNADPPPPFKVIFCSGEREYTAIFVFVEFCVRSAELVLLWNANKVQVRNSTGFQQSGVLFSVKSKTKNILTF